MPYACVYYSDRPRYVEASGELGPLISEQAFRSASRQHAIKQ